MAHFVTLDAFEPRRVIVHQHVMKCAGTTVATILAREFGAGLYHVHRPDSAAVIYGDDLAAFLRATPQARAITSHHLRYPVARGAVADIVDCCPVRRPLDRLESLYNFVRANASQPFHPLAADGIAAFLTALVDRHPDHVVNMQTAAMGMRDRYRAPSRATSTSPYAGSRTPGSPSWSTASTKAWSSRNIFWGCRGPGSPCTTRRRTRRAACSARSKSARSVFASGAVQRCGRRSNGAPSSTRRCAEPSERSSIAGSP